MTAPTPSPRPKLKSPSPNCRPSDALWYASPPRRRANSTSSVSPRPAAGTTNCSRAHSQHGRCPQFFLVRATQSRSSHSPMPRMSCWSRRRCWRSRHALFGPWPGPRPAACTTAAWRRRRRGAASGTRLIAARCSPPHPLTSWPQAAAQGLRRRRWLDCSCRLGCAAPARTQAVASIAVYWQLIFFVQCACDLASQDWPDGPKHAIHGSNIAQRSSCRSVVLGNTNFTLVLPSHPYRSFRRRQLLTRSNFEGTTQGTMASRGMMAGAQDIWDRETDAAGCPSRAEARAASGCSLRPLPLQRTILWASLSCLSG